MIYVNQKQLDQVQYLIEQSSRGHHVLFDIETIRTVFEKHQSLTPVSLKPIDQVDEDLDDDEENTDEKTEKHIENLILQPTLLSKKAYLEGLDTETFSKVVRTYFSIVENNIFESLEYSQ